MMVSLLLLALQTAAPPAAPPAAAPAAPPLAAIGPQALPARGCAAYLWSAAGDRQLVAMATAQPAALRLALDGRPTDLTRTEAGAPAPLGFTADATYRGGDVTATLAMQVVVRENLTQGAQVTDGILTVERAGRDTIVLPVAGLVGCRA